MLGGIFSQVIEALNRIGISSDAANASGTVHAKLADMKNTVATGQKVRGLSQSGTFTSSVLNTYETALDITGRGRLVDLAMLHGTNGTSVVIRVTIDGIVALHGHGDPSGVWQMLMEIPWIDTGGGATIFRPINGNYNVGFSGYAFKNSLKIEILCSDGTASHSVKWLYEKE